MCRFWLFLYLFMSLCLVVSVYQCVCVCLFRARVYGDVCLCVVICVCVRVRTTARKPTRPSSCTRANIPEKRREYPAYSQLSSSLPLAADKKTLLPHQSHSGEVSRKAKFGESGCQTGRRCGVLTAFSLISKTHQAQVSTERRLAGYEFGEAGAIMAKRLRFVCVCVINFLCIITFNSITIPLPFNFVIAKLFLLYYMKLICSILYRTFRIPLLPRINPLEFSGIYFESFQKCIVIRKLSVLVYIKDRAIMEDKGDNT